MEEVTDILDGSLLSIVSRMDVMIHRGLEVRLSENALDCLHISASIIQHSTERMPYKYVKTWFEKNFPYYSDQPAFDEDGFVVDNANFVNAAAMVREVETAMQLEQNNLMATISKSPFPLPLARNSLVGCLVWVGR